VVAAEGSWRESIPLRDVPITRNGKIGFQVENVMASVAAAWGAGLSWETVRRGLARVSSTTATTRPGAST
jgi:cyanophycin synthetase